MNDATHLLTFLRNNLGLPYKPVIAGGYARDLVIGATPRDIDVFLLVGMPELEEATNLLISELQNRYIPFFVHEKNYTESEGIPAFGPAIDFDFISKKVQLIPTPCSTAGQVVDNFDYDVCQFWINEAGGVEARSSHLIDRLVHRQMNLLHTRTPWSSLRRGVLLADRFNFQFTEEDKRRLVEALHEQLSH